MTNIAVTAFGVGSLIRWFAWKPFVALSHAVARPCRWKENEAAAEGFFKRHPLNAAATPALPDKFSAEINRELISALTFAFELGNKLSWAV